MGRLRNALDGRPRLGRRADVAAIHDAACQRGHAAVSPACGSDSGRRLNVRHQQGKRMTGNDETAWEAYRRDGCERAARLGNRGPMRFDEDGRLAQDILDAIDAPASMYSRACSRPRKSANWHSSSTRCWTTRRCAMTARSTDMAVQARFLRITRWSRLSHPMQRRTRKRSMRPASFVWCRIP